VILERILDYRPPYKASRGEPVKSTLRLVEHVDEHHHTHTRQHVNEGRQEPDRGDHAIDNPPHIPSQTNEQDKRQQAYPNQRKQRSSFEAHGGSMDLREAGCKRHRRSRLLKPVCGLPCGSRLCFLVLCQHRVANDDALIADTHAARILRRIFDERVYLVLRFAAK
jgi:hypothetical protein